jgi:hypothetical protein
MTTKDKTLQNELHVFEQHKHEWLQSHTGEFVVIADTNVGGFYPDYESAFKGGVSKFGVRGNFLVKQIWAEAPVYLIH